MKTAIPLLLIAALAPSALPADATASTEAPSGDTGSIVGVVKFKGKVPARQAMKVTTEDGACHKGKIYKEDLVVSKDGHLQWAVVTVKGVEAKVPERKPVLDQKGCVYAPHVVVVSTGEALTVKNSDGILHNVNVKGKKNRPKNRAMVGGSKELKMWFKRAERIPVKCDVHSWMRAWIVVTKDTCHAVSGPDGAFRIENVPAGTHTLQFWHETLGTMSQEVVVKQGEESKVEFEVGR